MDAADAGEKPSPAAAESSSRQQDSQWLATLSEPELDLLISLKDLAATRAKNAGHPRLADKFDLRTLRALGIVLLQNFKERLKETSVDPNILDRLALLSDSGADFTNSGSDSEVVRPPNED